MVIRDSETIVAAGQEIRMTSLNEVKAGANTGESYTASYAVDYGCAVYLLSGDASRRF